MSVSSTILVSVDSRAGKRRYEFRRPVVVVGSSRKCDIRISDSRFVNRYVALCAFPEGIIPIEFENERGLRSPRSGRPEMWNDGRLPMSGQLSLSDLGISARLSLSDGRTASMRELLALDQNRKSEHYGFQFLNATSRVRHTQLKALRDQVTLIGRRDPSHVKLSSPDVADVQCSIVRSGERLTLRNLHNDGMVRINGQLVHQGTLREGDELAVGSYRMLLLVKQSEALEQHRDAQTWSDGFDELNLLDRLRALFEGEMGGNREPSLTSHANDGCWDRFSGALQPLVQAINRLADSQSRLAEESALQRQLIERLISQLGDQQREAALHELRRSEMLTAELRLLRDCRAQSSAPPYSTFAYPPSPQNPTGPLENQSIPSLSAPLPFESDQRSSRTERKPEDVKHHRDLDSRLFKLGQERNGCFQRLVRILSGTSR